MESEFLEQWNAKFGAKPPEWVFTLTSQFSAQSLLEQDVDRELDYCQARIDKLRADLDQELFLVEWLRQQKASFSSAVSKPPTSQNSHVQGGDDGQAVNLCPTPDDQPTEQSSINLNGTIEEEKESSPKQSSPPGGHSPASQPPSHSEESVKSTPESCEYHTAPQSVGGDSSGNELEEQHKKATRTGPTPINEVKENGFSSTPDLSCRQRFAHKVNSADITIAKAVNRRLLEQQKLHWSCDVLNLNSVKDKLSPVDKPVFRKRAASDPSSQRSEGSELLFELKSKGGKRVLSSPVESPELPKKELQKVSSSAKESLKSSAQTSTNSTSDKLEKVVNSQTEEDNSEVVMTSEVEKRSSKEEDSIELRQWANLGSGKRSSNGILDNYEGYNVIVSPDEERDPALINVLAGAGRIRSSAHNAPRSSIDHLRDSPTEAATANGDSETNDNTSSPQRPSHNTQQTSVTELSPRRGIPPSLAKPERASLVFSEDECITPKGDSDHSMNIPNEDDDLRTKERSQTLVGGQEGTLNVSRVEKLLEEVQRTQDKEGEDDPAMMTLTRNNTDKFRKFGIDAEMDDSSQELTPLGSLDIDIQETLSKIQNTPDMSMATLLDVGENKKMNARFQASYTDPTLEDFEYTQGIDDATISALTLSNELFGSRSNSVSSLPGLYSNTESNTSISPPDMDSPSHATRQGVNLRNTGGAKRRDRKRIGRGNAELDMFTGASDEGSDLSPSHTVSSRSMSPKSELGSLASLTMSPSSPREFSGSDSSGGMADTMVSLIIHVFSLPPLSLSLSLSFFSLFMLTCI